MKNKKRPKFLLALPQETQNEIDSALNKAANGNPLDNKWDLTTKQFKELASWAEALKEARAARILAEKYEPPQER